MSKTQAAAIATAFFAFLLLAGVRVYLWVSQRAARREWAAYHRWIRRHV